MQMETSTQVGLPASIGNAGSPRSGLVIHYIGGSSVPRGDHTQCRRQIVGWHNYHRSLGWQGIGYSYLICHHGIVLTGRGLNRVGSHAPGANSTHVGICFILGGSQTPTASQLKGFRDLQGWLRARGVNSSNVTPHSRWIATSCPGDHLRGRVSSGNWGSGGTVVPQPGSGSGSAGTAGGMTSVRSILSQQRAVNGMGYTPRLVEDGLFGPLTNAGVRWAQGRLGVTQDGLWGNNTERAYNNRGNSSGPSVTVPSGSPLIRRGQRGTRVRQLQTALLRAGERLPRFGVDGDFGQETETALRSFQRKAGISVDGVYGNQSATALRRRLS